MRRTLVHVARHRRRPARTVRLAGVGAPPPRAGRGVTFLVVRDRSGLAQVVAARRAAVVPPEETPVEVVGTATANAQAPGGVEVTARGRRRRSPSRPTRPPSSCGGPPWTPRCRRCSTTRRRLAPPGPAGAVGARGRRPARLPRDARRLGFTEVATPKLVESATESGANVFALDYFGRPAYLAQSPQFFKQQLVGVFERVYEVGPGLPRRAARHRAPPRGVPLPRRRARLHRGPPRRAAPCCARCWPGWSPRSPRRPDAVERTGARLPVVPEEIPVIHFADALALVGAPADEPDLAPEHERALGEWALAEHGSRLRRRRGLPDGEAAVLHPSLDEAEPSDARWSNSFDLLFRGLELVTGGQRLHRPSDYERPSARAARTRRRTRPTCRRSGTGCRRTAASRSGSSAGSRGWSRRPTSAR